MNPSPSSALSTRLLLATLAGLTATATAAQISVDAANVRNSCSPFLYGSCIEDVNHEIYGGLYDQRLYGESFEEPEPGSAVAGWSSYGGQWHPAGASLSVDADQGAKLVRQQPQVADGSVEFDLRFTATGPASSNAGAIVRVNNAGVGADAFDGYEISLAADGSSIVLGRHQQNFASLKTASVSVDASQWQHLRVVLTGGRIQIYLNGSTTAVIDYTDANPLPAGSVGLRTWGSNAQFQNFKSTVGGQDTANTFTAVPTSIAGWFAYAGEWTPGGDSVSVAPVLGGKLVRQQPQFLDGSVDFDLRFNTAGPASNNAGAIVRVKNAGIGADAFDGYEIGLAANGSSIVLGRHQQNFASLQTAAVAVDPLQWQHLRVVLTGSRIQVYLNGSTTAVIDYTDANPLPAGSMGLRTWGSDVQFRNFKTSSGGQDVANSFTGISSAGVSGMWDPVLTGAAQASYSLDATQPFNGSQSQRIDYAGGTGMAGVANRGLNRWGISLKKDTGAYEGRVYLRGSNLQGNATVSLQSVDGSQTYATQTLSGINADWQKFPLSLTPSADDPNARLVVSLDAPGTLWIDQAVLLDPPSGRFHGLPVRKDIGDAMVAGGLKFVRYGGTAVNAPEYRWKKMIGDPDKRPPYLGHWHPYTTNGYGIEDFVAFCEAAKFTPAFAINVEETPEDMADMIEYLNGDATTHWGAIRAANGHAAPYGVKYIEIGNEEVIWGDIAADYDHYIDRFKILAAAMKKVDPNLVFINAAWWRTGNNPNCERVFKALEGLATYWDFHTWADDAASGAVVDRDLTEAKNLFQQWVPGSKMKVVIFEENGNRHDHQRALGHATTLNAVRRHGDFVFIDCEANGLQPWLQNDNGWDQGHVFFTPSQVWGMPPYYSQQMASATHQPLLIGSQVSDSTTLDVTATKSQDGKTLALHVVNLAGSAATTQLKVQGMPVIDSSAKVWTLSGNLGDSNTPENPTAIQPVAQTIGNASADFSYTFPAYSYTVLVLTSPNGTSAIDRAGEYALSHGLNGANSSSTADPDQDGWDNYSEWAFGLDPSTADSVNAGPYLRFTRPAAEGFIFEHRRLSDYLGAGLSYAYEVSPDLTAWHNVVPVEVSSAPLVENPGYEMARLSLPPAEVTDHGKLFLRIGAPH